MTTGRARRFLVGDPDIQYLDVVAGCTIDRLAIAEHHASKHEVVLDAPSVALLGDLVELIEWRGDLSTDDTHFNSRFAVVSRIAETVRLTCPPSAALSIDEAQLRRWVLPTLYEHEKIGLGTFVGELRPAVAFFLRFTGIDYNSETAGDRLDAFIHWVQQVIAHYGGNLLQLTFGDKGSYIYATFGAPVAHDNDSERALETALALQNPPLDADFAATISQVQIGISSGVMRTGPSGGRTRRTYTVLGDKVNLAARLMQRASPGQIVVSQQIAEGPHDRFRFNPLGTISVKGKQQAVAIFELVSRQTHSNSARRLTSRTCQDGAQVVGRIHERKQLTEGIGMLAQGKVRGPVLIEGEPGIGKSRLVEFVLAEARQFHIDIVIGAGNPIERTAPYHAWRPVFAQILGLNDLPDEVDARRQAVLNSLATEPELLRLAPLLNAVLPLDVY